MKVEGVVLEVLNYWRRLSSFTKRMWTVVGFFLLCIIVTMAGVLTPLSQQEAQGISRDLDQQRQNITSMGGFQQTATIFGNNFLITLITFVPFAGPVFGLYVMYSTGIVIAADSLAHNVSPPWVFLNLIVLPFAWMEFLAYSVAFAGSAWLAWRITQARARTEISKTCTFISICAVILVIAAAIEVYMIALVG